MNKEDPVRFCIAFLAAATLIWASANAQEEERKYIQIGANPVDPNRQLAPGEFWGMLPEDVETKVSQKTGEPAEGYLRAGEVVAVTRTTESSTQYRVVWIRACGNDVQTLILVPQSHVMGAAAPRRERSANVPASPTLMTPAVRDALASLTSLPQQSAMGNPVPPWYRNPMQVQLMVTPRKSHWLRNTLIAIPLMGGATVAGYVYGPGMLRWIDRQRQRQSNQTSGGGTGGGNTGGSSQPGGPPPHAPAKVMVRLGVAF